MAWWIVALTLAAIASMGVVLLAATLSLRARFRERLTSIWLALDETPRADERVFVPDLVQRLPKPVRRYFLHTIEPGTALASRVELQGEGEIRLGGAFRPFVSRELIAPGRGFVWRAQISSRRVVVEHYLDDRAETSTLSFGLWPKLRAQGPHPSRSARHRLAATQAIWLPTTLLPQNGVSWELLNASRAKAKLLIHDEPIDLILTVAEDGRLESVEVDRWTGQRPDAPWAFRPWVLVVREQRPVEGRTVPARLDIGYRSAQKADAIETDMKLVITRAGYRPQAKP